MTEDNVEILRIINQISNEFELPIELSTRIVDRVIGLDRETSNQDYRSYDVILKIKNLHKKYNEGKSNEVHALRGIDLQVNRGDMMAIMGPSGCGKTTLLNMIGHLDRNSGGNVFIDDINTNKLSDTEMTAFRRDNIGYIFQLFNLFGFLTAVENVETPLLLKGYKSGVAREQAKMLLRDLGMGDRLYHEPSELSGGQQQRVAIARALINQPAIILGDEPTGDLDSVTSAEIMKLFRRINKLNNQTLVLVTHNRWIAERCDYIVHMDDGLISYIEQGPFQTEDEL